MLPRWLIKLGFHLLYYQLAWTYELVAWLVSFGQWSTWRRLALLFMQPGPTLELAFGTGVFFIDMLEAGYQPLGIDLSPYMARQASRRLRQRNFELRLSRAKAQALPFPSNHFANVVATFPSDYLLEPQTLAEIQRVLRDPAAAPDAQAGRLVIVAEGQLRGLSEPSLTGSTELPINGASRRPNRSTCSRFITSKPVGKSLSATAPGPVCSLPTNAIRGHRPMRQSD